MKKRIITLVLAFVLAFCPCLNSCALGADSEDKDDNAVGDTDGGNGNSGADGDKENADKPFDEEDGANGNDENAEEEYTGPVVLAENGVAVFNVIYNKMNGNEITNDAIDSLREVFDEVGAELVRLEDMKTNVSDYEILIGKTSRDASIEAARGLGARDYTLVIQEKRIIAVGGSAYSTAIAVDKLMESIRREDGKLIADAPTEIKYIYEREKSDTVLGTIDEKRSAFADPYGRPMITAHRSEHVYSVENSIAGIISAVELGVDIIEIDLQKTKDGYYILCHDTTLTSSTNVASLAGVDGLPESHKVCDWTLDEIMRLTLKGSPTGERPVLLDDVFSIVRGKAILLFDKIKTDTDTNEIVDLAIKARSLDSVMFQFANSFNACERAYKLSGIPILFMHWKDNTDAAVSFVDGGTYRDRDYAIQAIQIGTPTTLPAKELTDKVRLKCRLYTNTLKTAATANGSFEADVEESWLALIGCGINIIQTDNPFDAVAALRCIDMPFSYRVSYNTSPVLKNAQASLSLLGDGRFYYTTEEIVATEEDFEYSESIALDESAAVNILFIDGNGEKYNFTVKILVSSDEYYEMLGLSAN